MNRKIAHFGDVHIFNLKRHNEYIRQFNKIYNKLIKQGFGIDDRIVIVGDLFEKFVDISNEAMDLAGSFLNNLADISPVIIVPGNHDLMKKNLTRLNSVRTLSNLLKNKNITYYGDSGFFEDEDLVWVNYSHIQKDILPWVDIKHKKDENKTYIGLFHDPVMGSTTDSGQEFSSSNYMKVSDFNDNDFVLLGDIHKRQYFRDNKSMAYCGSTVQNNFSESINNHGYLVWEIEDRNTFNVIEVNIPNDNNYINFTIGKDYDYDNIELLCEYINPKSNIKVKWSDYSSHVHSFENEVKIRKYFNDVHNINSIKIKKEAIYTDVNDVEMVNETIDVTDNNKQREIFIEYLKLNEYKDDFIDDVLKIDDIISNRLTSSKADLGITWSIDKLWFSNFKSYDDAEIEWSDIKGIVQVNAANAMGKTTIFDAISYVLYGQTTSPSIKKEKFADNKYINNKRDLNECSVGIHININGIIYTIIRKTVRKYKRDKVTISSVSSVIDYYIGTDITEENKLNDEQKKDTQNLIDKAIGSFFDFQRAVLCNADNINELISMDRSVFIDAITRDAGYSIFEDKLNELKSYKDEQKNKRITLNIDEVTEQKEYLLIENSNNNISLTNIADDIKDLEIEIVNLESTRDEKVKSLHNIKNEDIDISELELDIEAENENINKRKSQLEIIEKLKLELESYVPTRLEDKRSEYNSLKDGINKLNIEMKDFDVKVSEINSNIKSINMDIMNMVNNYVNDLKTELNTNNTEISNLRDIFKSKVIEYNNTLKDEFNEIIVIQNDYKGEIKSLMASGKTLKIENDKLETSKVCITCERELDENDVIAITKSISKNKADMLKIKDDVNLLKSKHDSLDEKLNLYKDKLDKLVNKDYSFDEDLTQSYKEYITSRDNYKNNNESIQKTMDLISENIYPNELKVILKPSYDDKTNFINKLSDVDDDKEELLKKIDKENSILDALSLDIKDLVVKEDEYNKKREKVLLEDKIKLNIDKHNTNISVINEKITKYNEELVFINENKKINESIELIKKELISKKGKLNQLIVEKSELSAKVSFNNEKIKDIDNNIKKYNIQLRNDEVLKVYMKCVHRDGLPTYLLKKSIHIINQSLNNILTDVDFDVYFDEDLKFKLYHENKLEISQNAIDSSGMERTFSAVALKIALRDINNKSKPNFIMFDEIMTKLVDESVNKFLTVLDNIKNNVDKLIIIEHIHPINYDYLIEVDKDDNGISSLQIF